MLAAKVAAQRSRDVGLPEHAVPKGGSQLLGRPLAAPKLLAVYATIYEELKGRRIDGTGVVATSLPLRLRAAISRNDPAAIDKEFHLWEPLIELPFTRESRDATIEEGRFPPLPLDRLDEDYAGRARSVGERICQNCDVRYSCSAYRGGRRVSPFRAGSRLCKFGLTFQYIIFYSRVWPTATGSSKTG